MKEFVTQYPDIVIGICGFLSTCLMGIITYSSTTAMQVIKDELKDMRIDIKGHETRISTIEGAISARPWRAQ